MMMALAYIKCNVLVHKIFYIVGVSHHGGGALTDFFSDDNHAATRYSLKFRRGDAMHGPIDLAYLLYCP